MSRTLRLPNSSVNFNAKKPFDLRQNQSELEVITSPLGIKTRLAKPWNVTQEKVLTIDDLGGQLLEAELTVGDSIDHYDRSKSPLLHTAKPMELGAVQRSFDVHIQSYNRSACDTKQEDSSYSYAGANPKLDIKTRHILPQNKLAAQIHYGGCSLTETKNS